MALTYGFCLGEEDSKTTSSEFSLAFQAAFGDGVCPYDGKFEVTSTDSMNVSINTGFALVQGRWIKSDEVESLVVQPSDNNFDRYDAVVIRVNIPEKSMNLVVVKGVATAFPIPYTPTRTGEIYEIVLCSILVRMGTTQILSTDITDTRSDESLCGFISTLSDIANDVIYVDQFLDSGIDEQVSELENMAQQISSKADQTVQAIEQAMQQANVSKSVGEVEVLHDPPSPANAWLLCDGSAIPPEYTELYALLDGQLPNIAWSDERFKSYIYAGIPS